MSNPTIDRWVAHPQAASFAARVSLAGENGVLRSTLQTDARSLHAVEYCFSGDGGICGQIFPIGILYIFINIPRSSFPKIGRAREKEAAEPKSAIDSIHGDRKYGI
ncbi:MAG: hypothetical protein WBC69_16095 [Geitlerinemataceae cyanobacterium]